MTYEEVIYTIENKRRFGKACGRDVTEEMLEVLGHPEQGMEVIHIAGTNGKGSVAAFVSSILGAASFYEKNNGGADFKVGTFTSPHLVDFTERIQVDGVQIPQADATRIGQELLGLKLKLEPTMFDYCLAMALIYFKEQGVRFLVLETGLGGAKDSTRGLATVPQVSVITSIGLEHTAILGDTLALIAGEKAGILRTGTTAVLGDMEKEALGVITDKCRQLKVPVLIPGQLPEGQALGLFGAYQRKNGAVAAEACRHLSIGISEDIIEKGLEQALWPGRMQILSHQPFIMIDGAHNPSGVQALSDSLAQAFGQEKYTFIMAVMADKDYVEMARIVSGQASRIFTCTVDYSRALQAAKLAEALEQEGIKEAKSFDSYEAALEAAKQYSQKIIAFGSLYFIGEVLTQWSK